VFVFLKIIFKGKLVC